MTLIAGVRRERFRINATDVYDPAAPGGAFGSGAPSGAQRESEYAYELGVRYQFLPGAALIGKAGRSYRFANVDETYETDVRFHQPVPVPAAADRSQLRNRGGDDS